MNSQERDLLTQLLRQLGEVKLTTKDAEAETLIREATAHQPDAAYLLVQRALLLEHALNTTKAQNAELQSQLQNNQSGQQAVCWLTTRGHRSLVILIPLRLPVAFRPLNTHPNPAVACLVAVQVFLAALPLRQQEWWLDRSYITVSKT